MGKKNSAAVAVQGEDTSEVGLEVVQGGKTRRPRGFAALAQTEEGRARVREIAGRGGRKAHELGTAHEFTSEEARVCGRKGGQVSAARTRARKAISG